jgi:hypothetical protein
MTNSDVIWKQGNRVGSFREPLGSDSWNRDDFTSETSGKPEMKKGELRRTSSSFDLGALSIATTVERPAFGNGSIPSIREISRGQRSRAQSVMLRKF